jgi:hypothetical protein
LPAWISDTLCRLATGGGFAVRQLYTDQNEVLFDAARPVILNGVEDIVTRPDLADLYRRWPALRDGKSAPRVNEFASWVSMPQHANPISRIENNRYPAAFVGVPGLISIVLTLFVTSAGFLMLR